MVRKMIKRIRKMMEKEAKIKRIIKMLKIKMINRRQMIRIKRIIK